MPRALEVQDGKSRILQIRVMPHAPSHVRDDRSRLELQFARVEPQSDVCAASTSRICCARWGQPRHASRRASNVVPRTMNGFTLMILIVSRRQTIGGRNIRTDCHGAILIAAAPAPNAMHTPTPPGVSRNCHVCSVQILSVASAHATPSTGRMNGCARLIAPYAQYADGIETPSSLPFFTQLVAPQLLRNSEAVMYDLRKSVSRSVLLGIIAPSLCAVLSLGIAAAISTSRPTVVTRPFAYLYENERGWRWTAAGSFGVSVIEVDPVNPDVYFTPGMTVFSVVPEFPPLGGTTSIREDLPAWSAAERISRIDDVMFWREEAYGWPSRCLAVARVQRLGTDDMIMIDGYAIAPAETYGAVFPSRILLRGLLLNTFLYWGVLLALVGLTLGIRRYTVCRGDTTCPCGYDLHGITTSVCPECGRECALL
jgi:hypothetical protein